jgi:hypothetical protein
METSFSSDPDPLVTPIPMDVVVTTADEEPWSRDTKLSAAGV